MTSLPVDQIALTRTVTLARVGIYLIHTPMSQNVTRSILGLDFRNHSKIVQAPVGISPFEDTLGVW